jgi:hypothetical protein
MNANKGSVLRFLIEHEGEYYTKRELGRINKLNPVRITSIVSELFGQEANIVKEYRGRYSEYSYQSKEYRRKTRIEEVKELRGM